jgi:hypothetical protein
VLRRSLYKAELADLPPGLFAYWAEHAGAEFEGIPRDRLFFCRAAEALLQFFDCVANSDAPCALPSKAADSVWHAWLRYSPMGVEQFCIRHFGQAIPHVEAAGMGGPLGDSLAVCLVKARTRERLARGGASLPRLFEADRKLGMPQGYAYRVKHGRVGLSSMDKNGKPQADMVFPPAFDPAMLMMSGLIHPWEAGEATRRRGAGRDDGGGFVPGFIPFSTPGETGCDSGASSDSSSSCDTGSSGSSCGSSGGSSCGSGCGSSS